MPRPNLGPRLHFLRQRNAFYIQWYDHGAKRQRSTGTAERGEAEKQLASFLLDRLRDVRPIGPRDPGDFPIADALSLYADEHAPTTGAPWRIAHAIDALLPFWGALTASAVTQETCRAYTRERGKADGTIRKELGTLRAALNFAHRYGRLTRVPHVFLPSKPEGKTRWLTRDETARLLHASLRTRGDTRLYLPLFVVLGIYTGARKEAILSLRWPQVDWKNRKIDLNPVGRKQTTKTRPIIPIPNRLMTFLRLARRRGSDLGYVINRDGRPILDIGDAKNGSFGSACARAGLSDVTPHTLRHTCGTWMAQKGVPLFQIGGWLGHSDARTTELYAHHHPSHLEAARLAADRR